MDRASSRLPKTHPSPHSLRAGLDDLTQADHDILSWTKRREADHDVDHPLLDVIGGGRALIADDEVRLARRDSLERALPEETLHERSHVHPELCPESLPIRALHRPAQRVAQRPQDVARGAAHRDVLPFARHRVRAIDRARAEVHGAVHRKLPDDVEPDRIEDAVLFIGHEHRWTVDTRERRFGPRGCGPYAGLAVDPCD